MTVNSERATRWPRCKHRSKRTMMAAFDRLPAPLRAALADAHYEYCAACAERQVRGISVGYIDGYIRSIADADRQIDAQWRQRYEERLL